MDRAQRVVLPVALGVSDGVLNALVLAASSLLLGEPRLSLELALRIALAALATSLLTVFVAEYSNLRLGLRRAERELNLTRAGKLATSNLGRAILREAAASAVVAATASCAGAPLPLALGAALPEAP